MDACDLTQQKCKPCEGGVSPLTPREIEQLLKQLRGWQYKDGVITKTYEFKELLPDHGVRKRHRLDIAPGRPPSGYDRRLQQVPGGLLDTRHQRNVGKRFHLRGETRCTLYALSGRAKKRAHNIEAGTVVASFGRQFAVEVTTAG